MHFDVPALSECDFLGRDRFFFTFASQPVAFKRARSIWLSSYRQGVGGDQYSDFSACDIDLSVTFSSDYVFLR